MPAELETTVTASQDDVREAFKRQSPFSVDDDVVGEDAEDRGTDAEDALDRQIFASLVTP
jgi:hypothetical protein